MREALDSVRPYMESHGGDVELLGLEDGVARLRLKGSCNGCAASAVDARAGDQAGARGGRARPAGIEVEGVVEPTPRRRRPGCAADARRCARPTPSWIDARRRRRRGAGRAAPATVAACRWSSPTSTARCSPTATRCAGCGAPLRGGDARRRHARPARRCGRSFVLPRAGRALGRRTAPARAGAAARATARGVRVAVAVTAVDRRRRSRRAPQARRALRRRRRGGAAGPRRGRALRPVRRRDARRPPPPAPPRRAADRLRVRDVLGAALRRSRATGPTGHAHVWLEGFDAARRALGRVPDPDRARVLPAQQRRRRRGRRSTRARRARPRASSTSTRGSELVGAEPGARGRSSPTPRR